MKFGVVNKSTTVNRFVLHILQRNITHLAVITRKTNINLGILKGGGNWKRAEDFLTVSENATEFSRVNKRTTVNRFVLHTAIRNIMRLALTRR